MSEDFKPDLIGRLLGAPHLDPLVNPVIGIDGVVPAAQQAVIPQQIPLVNIPQMVVAAVPTPIFSITAGKRQIMMKSYWYSRNPQFTHSFVLSVWKRWNYSLGQEGPCEFGGAFCNG